MWNKILYCSFLKTVDKFNDFYDILGNFFEWCFYNVHLTLNICLLGLCKVNKENDRFTTNWN